MRIKTKIPTLCCLCLLAASAAFGQVAAVHTPCEPLDRHEDPAGQLMRVVLDAPYSADLEISATHVLEDGTKIEKKGEVVHQYRDSLGRTRYERAPEPPMIGRVSPLQALGLLVSVEIKDPVALKEYELYPSRHEARVRNAPELAQRTVGSQSAEREFPPRAPADPDQPRPKFEKEYFGTQSIDGLQAVGVKEVTTFPIGWNGNDRPYSTSHESWCSLDLHVIILNKLYNPSSGERIQRLTNIQRSEPDPSLFEVPAGYTIAEMKPGTVISLAPAVNQGPNALPTPIR